jgi:hypothetical protein
MADTPNPDTTEAPPETPPPPKILSPEEFDKLQDYPEQSGFNPLEMAQTAIEQGLSGATLGVSKGLETHPLALGLPAITTPEAIAAREQKYPVTSALSNVAGTAGSLFLTGGLSAAAPGAAALTGAAGVGARLGIGALEGATIGGVNQVTDDWSQDKALDAQKILAATGLGAGLGAAGAGIGEFLKYKLGTPLAKEANSAIQEAQTPIEGIHRPVISQLDAAPFQAGDFKTAIENTSAIPEADAPKILAGVSDLKPNAAEVVKAAQDIGSPVLEGMTSKNPYVQKAEDLLIGGAPTYSGIQRQKLYQQVYDAVSKTASDVIGEGSPYTKAELGNQFKNSITQQIAAQAKPISDIYDAIKQYHSIIPLSEDAAPAIAKELGQIQEFRVSPSSPEGQLVNRVMKEIPNLKTVDDVKAYNSVLNRSISPTAPSGEKRMAGIISDKLGELENNSVTDFAKSNQMPPEAQPAIQNLIAQRESANAAYKPFRQDLNTLAEQLGKGKVYGAQDAINFIQDRLTPEEVTQKLFSKNNSEFLKFFAKKYPAQMQMMLAYQKGVIRDAASKGGRLTPNTVFREVNKLQPEIQQSLFSPQELQKLKSAQTVAQSIPKSFNTSNTNNAAVFRAFMTSPHGALLGNARDLALSQFIKMGGGKIAQTTSDALQGHVADTSNRLEKGVKNLFSSGASQARKINNGQ